MASGVKDIDRGWKKILREFRRTAPNLAVIVGIQGGDASSDHGGITNVELGVIHEFGAPAANIPERSFLRSTIDRERLRINKLMLNAAKKISKGQSLKSSLELVGVFAVGAIRRTFDSSVGLVRLKASTIAQKGSSRPLINTSQLKQSITSKVVT